MKNIFKTIFLNFWLIVIVVLVEFLLLILDKVLTFPNFHSTLIIVLGTLILLTGIVFRIWASFIFFQNELKVLSVKPQSKFIRKGPYKISRNPLYIGIICIVLGIAFIIGSPSSVVASILLIIFWNFYTRLVDEKRMLQSFGEDYRQYEKEVPRWFSFRVYNRGVSGEKNQHE